MARNIGIDLGTTNSVIASYDEKGHTVIPVNEDGDLYLPSVVTVLPSGEIITGKKAKQRLGAGDPNTVGSFKVEMGSSKKYKIGGGEWTPVMLSAEILRSLRIAAEKYYGEKIEEAVITVPAYFTELQRTCTIEAGKLAGLTVKRIINEPTAAALSYGINTYEEKTVLVYDLGGGTFDASLLDIAPGTIDVIAVRGDNFLGGDNFDADLRDAIISALEKMQMYKVSSMAARQVLTEIAKEMKEGLTYERVVTDSLERLAKVDSEFSPLSSPFVMTREFFEKVISSNISRTVKLVQATVEQDAKMKMEDVTEILLVGGSTRIPLVAEVLRKLTNRPVLEGAVDPDLAVAIGAAIQASIASDVNSSKKMVLLDVTPLNLSVEVEGELASVVIPANTSLPARRQKIYTNSVDNQTRIEFKILQGNKAVSSGNTSLGSVYLENLRPAPAKMLQFEVTFDLNVNGELTVTALDIATMREVKATRTLK